MNTAIAICLETILLFVTIAIIEYSGAKMGIDPREHLVIGTLQAATAIAYFIVVSYEFYALEKTLEKIKKRK